MTITKFAFVLDIWFSVVLVLGILSIFNLLIVIADWSALLNINNFLTEDGKTEAT